MLRGGVHDVCRVARGKAFVGKNARLSRYCRCTEPAAYWRLRLSASPAASPTCAPPSWSFPCSCGCSPPTTGTGWCRGWLLQIIEHRHLVVAHGSEALRRLKIVEIQSDVLMRGRSCVDDPRGSRG